MATTKPLNASGRVTFGASGSGTVDISVPGLETWRVTKIALSTTTNVLEPIAFVYVDTAAPGNLLGGTYTGSNDSSNEDQTLMPGQHLVCTWSGGDVGAVATLSVFGTRTS